MTQRIIYQEAGKPAAIIVPAPGVDISACIGSVPNGVPYDIVPVGDVPSDRTFRNAWDHDPAEPTKRKTNLPKARLIAHDKRRAKRDQLFTPLDREASRPGAPGAAAEAARQIIRDNDAVVQTDIDAAVDEAALKAVIVAYEAS